MTSWTFEYDFFSPEGEGVREALTTLGNGYFATRGAAFEAEADRYRYPGTYLAGGYNRLTSDVAGQRIEHEDLVNLPNWLLVRLRFERDGWLDLLDVEIESFRQALDLRRGLFERQVSFLDRQGRRSHLSERRIVHMGERHLAALEITITPENWSGPAEFLSAIDGTVVNAGVARYRGLSDRHLAPILADEPDAETIRLKVGMTQSDLRVAEAARTRAWLGNDRIEPHRTLVSAPDFVGHSLACTVEKSKPLRLEKIVSLHSSRDDAVSECGDAAVATLGRAGTFETLLDGHEKAWGHLWRRSALEFEETRPGQRTEGSLRLHQFHLLQTLSPHTADLDAGVSARGLHGEAYRGHVFWDEIFVLPALGIRLPDTARALLEYRYRRLPAARADARRHGHRGAMFPWQSGSDGREESQILHLNPRSGRWIPDHTHLQRHVNAAIAYNVWQYYQATGDIPFLRRYGAELMVEIARLWASLTEWNEAHQRYDIKGVMGPDEYHDSYPGASVPGLDNNSYTNLMAVWTLRRAEEALEALPSDRRAELSERIGLAGAERDLWRDVAHKMKLVFHEDGILSQFEGYEALREFDWHGYVARYGDIQRLDRILEAEGDSTNSYKVSKQADVLMLFYLLSADELAELFSSLGYPFDADTIPRTVGYYRRRTSHGSTLSRVVHSWVLSRGDRWGSWDLFREALMSDIEDIQGGTTREGIHLGAMAGTVDLIERCYTGLEMRGDTIFFSPCLPDELASLTMRITYRGQPLEVTVSNRELEVRALEGGYGPPIRVSYKNVLKEVPSTTTVRFPLEG